MTMRTIHVDQRHLAAALAALDGAGIPHGKTKTTAPKKLRALGADLLPVLRLARRVAGTSNLMPIARMAYIGGGRIETTDLATWLRIPCPDIGDPILVDVDALTKLVKTGTREVRIAEGAATIDGVRYAYAIDTLPIWEWPVMPAPDDAATVWRCPADELITAVRAVKAAIGNDPAYKHLHVVQVRDGLTTATNGHWGAWSTLPEHIAPPSRVLGLHVSILPAIEAMTGEVTVQHDDVWLNVSDDSVRVITRASQDRPYPDLGEFIRSIPLDAEALDATGPVSELTDAIVRLLPVARSVDTLSPPVELCFDDGAEIRVCGTESRVALPGWMGHGVIRLDARYLVGALTAYGGDRPHLRQSDDSVPVYLGTTVRGACVMPLRED